MDIETWLPIYREIAAEFGYDETADAAARDLAEGHLSPFALDRLDASGATVGVVVGAALDAEARYRARGMDQVIATGDALAPLERADIPVRVGVTDLDSDPAFACARTRQRGVLAVHAHGDNRGVLRRWLSRMRLSNVLGTTQVRPSGSLINVGGFTDGDRAAFLAHALGAETIRLIGWNLDDTTVSPIKRHKLAWAARLLTRLERLRGERYDALDGHRDDPEGR